MPLPDSNDPELYWAAGFIEGEGSFIFNPGDRSVRAEASQKEREPLERLQRIFGGGIYRDSGQGVFRWRTTGKYAEREAVILLLRPLMSTRRQGQIDSALARYKAHPGSDLQRKYNAKRAKAARERYWADPEYRERRLLANRIAKRER